MGVFTDELDLVCIYETLSTRLAKYHRMNDITLLLCLYCVCFHLVMLDLWRGDVVVQIVTR
jgi:hypothetical protein